MSEHTLTADSLRRRAFAKHRAGLFLEALALYEEALAVASEPADVARIKAGQASTRWARGEVETATALAEEARDLAELARDHGALADAWVAIALIRAATGDPQGNARAYEVALEHATAAGETDTEVRILTNSGSRLSGEGSHEEARERLERALLLLEGAVEEPDDRGGTALMGALAHHNLGDAYLGLGRVAEALHEYERAQAAWLSQESPMRAHATLGLGDAYRIRGLPTQAAVAYRDAIAIAETTGSAQVLVPALAGLSRVRVEDDPLEARAALARCLTTPAALGDVTGRLAAGWLALDAGELRVAVEHARGAEAEAGRRRDRAALADALELLAILMPDGAHTRLVEAAQIWREIGNELGSAVNTLLQARLCGDRDDERDARRTLNRLGISDAAVRAAGPLRAIGAAPSAALHVRVLGRLAVLRDGEPLPVWTWQSRKCRDVVKVLTAHPRGIGREALAELLWPGERGTSGRLSVVLSTLRTLLDPDREGRAGTLVLADRSSVRLDPAHVEVDAWEFERRATAALRADGPPSQHLPRLEEVAASYTGPFAEDDPYADWAVPVRNRLESLVDQVRRSLADRLLAAGRPAPAIGWYLGLVSADVYDEASHRGLLRALHADRRHGQVRRHYAEYCDAMSELGESPATLSAILTDATPST